MAMVLILLGISLVLTVVTAVLLASLTRPDDAAAQPHVEATRRAPAPRFFERRVEVKDPVTLTSAPLEVLLLQINQHVRLEHAAAELFNQYPTVESLHRRTASPLVH
jgi:hypothetical protein